MTRLGWVTENNYRPCNHKWRKEFTGDGINWGMGTRYRKCSKCSSYQRYHALEKKKAPEPYPPCKQHDWDKINKEVKEAINRAGGGKAYHIIVVVADATCREGKDSIGGKE